MKKRSQQGKRREKETTCTLYCPRLGFDRFLLLHLSQAASQFDKAYHFPATQIRLGKEDETNGLFFTLSVLYPE